jgi:hypothetical protein
MCLIGTLHVSLSITSRNQEINDLGTEKMESFLQHQRGSGTQVNEITYSLRPLLLVDNMNVSKH